MTLSTSSVPSFRLSTSVSSGSAISAIRTSTGDYPFERKIFPPVSSTEGNHREAFNGLREVSTTSILQRLLASKKTVGVVRVVRTTSFQFESSRSDYAFSGRKILSD